MVELRPSEFPNIVSSDEQVFRGEGMSRSCLHYRRFALSATDAIGWYQGSMDGDVRLPVDQNDDPQGDGGVLLRGGPFSPCPAWPTLEASNKLDFAPDWVQGSRAHFLRPAADLSARVLATVQCEVNRRQLERWLHFDLVHFYSDQLGAICLVAPNPLFRSIEKSHLDTPTDGSAETVAYKLIGRAGQDDVDGTRLEVTNESLRGRLTPVVAKFTDDPVRKLEFTSPIYKEGRTVTHPRYGLLAWNEPMPLIRAIRVGWGVVRQKTVEVPCGGKKKPAYNYSVPELEDGGATVVGRIDDEGMEARAVAAARRRAERATENAEHWFQDARRDAAQFIRDEIGKARYRVFIADPYFLGRELIEFGGATRQPRVEVRVLTSVLAFKRKTSTDAATLQAAVAAFAEKPSIRVLNPPRLHDRFLVVDETVWFSGNSLNSIGERAAMIVRLSYPEPIVAHLEGMWATATPLADWSA